MSDEDYRSFVKSFLNFLKKQIRERSFGLDNIESLEVATQCLEAVYNITHNDYDHDDILLDVNEAAMAPQAAADGAAGGDNEKDMKGAVGGAIPRNRNPNAFSYESIDLFELFQTAYVDITPERQRQAENIKNEGNELMKEGKFNEALFCYNKAISLDAKNPVFYCNRAAAFIRLNEFEKAISDCKMSLIYNPNYSRAFGRMGIAYSNLQRYNQACEAYQQALQLEPDNEDYLNNLRIAQERIQNNVEQNILQNLPIDNPELRTAIVDMLSDPVITMASRQVAAQMMNVYPGMITGVRDQLLNLATQSVRGEGNGIGDLANLINRGVVNPPATKGADGGNVGDGGAEVRGTVGSNVDRRGDDIGALLQGGVGEVAGGDVAGVIRGDVDGAVGDGVGGPVGGDGGEAVGGGVGEAVGGGLGGDEVGEVDAVEVDGDEGEVDDDEFDVDDIDFEDKVHDDVDERLAGSEDVGHPDRRNLHQVRRLGVQQARGAGDGDIGLINIFGLNNSDVVPPGRRQITLRERRRGGYGVRAQRGAGGGARLPRDGDAEGAPRDVDGGRAPRGGDR